MEDKILEAIIIGYRKWIRERYDFNSLSGKYEMRTLTEPKIEGLKSFFLDYVYPDISKRNELNEAFESLDGYIKNPRKLLNLLSTSARLLFKYGRDLPKILNAAIKTLRSFRAANVFESQLAKAAKAANAVPPYEIDQMKEFVATLSREDIDNFINGTHDLFASLVNDRKLVKKIKALVSELVSKMKAKPDVFSSKEVKGIELGLELIVQADALLETLSAEEQEYIVEMVVAIEEGVIAEVFSS